MGWIRSYQLSASAAALSKKKSRKKKELLIGWLKCCFTSTETVGLLGTGAQDVHMDFHTGPVSMVFITTRISQQMLDFRLVAQWYGTTIRICQLPCF